MRASTHVGWSVTKRITQTQDKAEANKDRTRLKANTVCQPGGCDYSNEIGVNVTIALREDSGLSKDPVHYIAVREHDSTYPF